MATKLVTELYGRVGILLTTKLVTELYGRIGHWVIWEDRHWVIWEGRHWVIWEGRHWVVWEDRSLSYMEGSVTELYGRIGHWVIWKDRSQSYMEGSALSYGRVGILLTCGKHFHDRIISLKGEIWANKTS